MKRKLLSAFIAVPLTVMAMQLQAQTLITSESRCVNTGTVIVDGLVGAGSPYQVSIVNAPPDYVNPGSHLTAALPDTIEALYPGSYTLRVIDKNGVQFDSPFNISGNYVLPGNEDYNPTTTAVSNCTSPNGTIQGILSDGRAPYTYTIISGPAQVGTTNTTGTFINLPAGMYSVQAADSCQNLQTRNVTISGSSTSFVASNAVINRIACGNFTLDSLTLSPATSATFTYEVIDYLRGPTGGTVIVATGTSLPLSFSLADNKDIADGFVQIRITDACGNAIALQPGRVANDWDFTAADVTVTCAAGVVLNGVTTSGTITPSYTTVITPFNPNSDPVAGQYTAPQTVTSFPFTITGVSATSPLLLATYTTITDGCGMSKSVTNDLTFLIKYQNTKFLDCSITSLNLSASGGFTNPVIYSVTRGDTLIVASNGTGNFNLPDGTYRFSGMDACGKETTTGLATLDHKWKLSINDATLGCDSGAFFQNVSVPARSIGMVTTTQYEGGTPVTAASVVLATQNYSGSANGVPSNASNDAADWLYFVIYPGHTYTYVAIDSCGKSDTITYDVPAGPGHQPMTHTTTVKNKCINKGDIIASWYNDNPSWNNVIVKIWAQADSTTLLLNLYTNSNTNTVEYPNGQTLLADLPLGTYIIKYSLSSCSSIYYDTVHVAPYVQPKVLTAQSFPPCASGGNPVIVRAVDGVGPYMYEIINSTPSHYTMAAQASPVFTLPTNQTSVTVRVLDACSNSSTRTVSITRASTPVVRSSTASFTACTLPLNFSLSIDSLYIGSVFEWTKLTGTDAGSAIIGSNPSLPLIFNSIADTATYQVRLTVPNTCFEMISTFSVPNVIVTCLPSVSGTVFDDANGLTDSTINGIGTNAAGLNAILVNSSNQIVAIVPVSADGKYNFLNVAANTYSIVISTATATVGGTAPATLLPSGWVSTGENSGTGTGNDGTVNGILPGIIVNSIDVADANFGIEQLPTANDVTSASQINPGGAIQITMPVLNGNDAEDGLYDGVSGINSIVITSLPTNGTLYYNGNPVVAGDTIHNYNPTLLTVDPVNGTNSIVFTYQEMDADLQLSDTATVTMPFTNAVPVADADIVSTDINTPVTMPILANDNFGADGASTATAVIVTPPAHGTTLISDNGTPANQSDDWVVYTPDAGYTGTDSLIYQICDSNGDCDTALVIITINAVNSVPVANHDVATTNEDIPVAIPVLNNDDFGADGPSTGTVIIIAQPNNGTAVVNNGGTATNPADDEVTYTPNPNFNGSDTLIYQICDSNGDCDTALVVVTIAPSNDVPVANADVATTTQNTPVTIPVLPNDDFGGDGPGISIIVITGQPINGTATVNDNGTPTDPTDDKIVYTANPNYNGSDSLIYQICDSNGDCDTALVVVNIPPVNTVPVAVADSATTTVDVPVIIPVLIGDDFGGDGPSTGTITITDSPNNGTATVNDNGTPTNPADDEVVYTPNAGYNGNDTLIYQICDNNGDCDTALVVIDILSTVPVTLSGFDARALANSVSLSWKVQEEIGISHYEVEFGTDGKNFSGIGSVDASGKINYGLHHFYPVNGNNYYRLKIVDNTGRVSYSAVVLVRFNHSNFTQVTISPNPFGGSLQLKFLLAKKSSATVKIYEGAGQLVYNNKFNGIAGSNSVLLTNLSGLAKGIYTIVITTDEFTEVQKVLKR